MVIWRAGGQNEWNEYQRASNCKQPKADNLIRLASVKTDLYNPQLPTYRKIDRDDVMGKLADEHCRHTWSMNLRENINERTYYERFKSRIYD